MNDNTPAIAQEMQSRLMRLPGGTRFVMGAQMFDAARAIIIMRVAAETPGQG